MPPDAPSGETAHHRALESLYDAAPINRLFESRLEQPIDFAAVDDMPVDFVFMLLSPPDAGAAHLKTLARVSRALRDPGFVAKLRGAGSPDALYALLTAAETRDAA
jgi:PTS system nitrogen regulatory IIA component